MKECLPQIQREKDDITTEVSCSQQLLGRGEMYKVISLEITVFSKKLPRDQTIGTPGACGDESRPTGFGCGSCCC